MTTPPEDIDALFDAPAPPSPVKPANPFAPASHAEGRKEHRVKVSWPARVQLPGGKVLELRVRDLSESGVGLMTDFHIPPSTVLNFAIGVPGLNEPTKITPVTGTIKTTYVVVQGRDLVCGGMWVTLPQDSRELLDKWIRRLRK
ncbi:MAG: PilZ domain-containing protein [Betaproteobacteria bacterium]